MEQNITINEAPLAGDLTTPKNRRFEGFSCTFPTTAKVKVFTFNELKHIENPPAPDFCPQPVMQVAGFFVGLRCAVLTKDRVLFSVLGGWGRIGFFMNGRMSWVNSRRGGNVFFYEQVARKNMMKNAEKGSCEEIEAKKMCSFLQKSNILLALL